MPDRGTLIAVPFYQNAQLAGALTDSLLRCAGDVAAVAGEIVFYNDSPDHAPLAAALAASSVRLGCRVHTNPDNLGFVRTMNLAVAEAVTRGMNLLLLNSDTAPQPGALAEMARVAALDTMHGFVNPRSDNATLATLPVAGRLAGRPAPEAPAVHAAYAARLPPFSYVPTAVGFCLLVAWEILAEFGGFDEIYGAGYNEENDLVMRASRVGYRAVLANHAFVAHQGEASFGLTDMPRSARERVNRAILDARYPEYAVHTRRYYDTPEVVAERLLACLVADAAGMLDVAIDCSSFVAARNGTFQAGRQLVQAAAAAWTGRFRLHVLCSRAVFDFHALDLPGVTRVDPHDGRCFAAIFRIGQPYDWNALQRVCMTGAVLGVYMLDTISLDCPLLASPLLENLWQFTMDQFDMLATQSRQTDRTLRLRLRVPPEMIAVIAPHSTDLADYPPPSPVPLEAPRTLLVVGNHYPHKHVAATAARLAAAFPAREVVAMGIAATDADGLAAAPNLRRVALGQVADDEIARLYAGASCVIFPSFAEGFGFPTLNALAAGRPLLARRLPATEEIWQATGRNPNVHFYDTTAELLALLRTEPSWQPAWPVTGGPQSADGIGAALDAAISRAGYPRIVARVRAMQFASDAGKTGAAETDPPVIAAGLVARRVEGVARRLFERPLVFRGIRFLVRLRRRKQSFFEKKDQKTFIR